MTPLVITFVVLLALASAARLIHHSLTRHPYAYRDDTRPDGGYERRPAPPAPPPPPED